MFGKVIIELIAIRFSNARVEATYREAIFTVLDNLLIFSIRGSQVHDNGIHILVGWIILATLQQQCIAFLQTGNE